MNLKGTMETLPERGKRRHLKGMDTPMPAILAHPAGEGKTFPHYPVGTWPLDTPSGRFYAEWDDQSFLTREGQLIFFFQFLQAGGRWAAFLRDCPLQ
jgi:hypothetical protein